MGELATSCSISSSEAKHEVEVQGELLRQQSKRIYEEDRNHKSKRAKKKQRSSEEMMEEGDDGGGESRSNGLVVRWERLLPRMAFRVLLVEADDSTRQIIAALLRKCSYRVAAVSDGLKAWELLKERPHNIDLILTEENLPSISGYALLTLIMEHEICKNIPVIMMSKEDSISTVYKCMMRGAADYLVKPIRRNELRNLWQHVWRRHSQATRDNLPQDESVGEDRAEGASENNAASNHSTDVVAFVPKNKECAEKESDAQSSCTKPDADAEGPENVQDFLQPVGDRLSLNETTEVQRCEPCTSTKQNLLIHKNKDRGKDLDATTPCKDIGTETERPNTDINREAGDSNGPSFNKEGIDFMGVAALKKSSAENIKDKFDSYPDLDLSLRSSQSGELETQLTEARHALRHSTTSAFTRYVGRPLHTQYSTGASVYNEKDVRADFERNVSNVIGSKSGDTPTPSVAGVVHRTTSLPNSQAKESEVGCSLPQQRIFTIPTPASDQTRNSDSNPGYSSMLPPFFYKQPVESQLPIPCPASHPAEAPHHPSNYDRQAGPASDCINTSSHKQERKLEDLVIVSPLTDLHTSNSFRMGHASVNSIGYGSNNVSACNVDEVATARGVAAESSRIDEGVFAHMTNSHRSMLREAALNKFRLKRKERCFEKKVRYDSRKKLAEQRPRVKGQFVRQAPVEGAAPE